MVKSAAEKSSGAALARWATPSAMVATSMTRHAIVAREVGADRPFTVPRISSHCAGIRGSAQRGDEIGQIAERHRVWLIKEGG
jgi:hypothetical protein